MTRVAQQHARLSHVYARLLNPDLESDPEIRRELGYIRTLEVNVAFPFLMPVYRDFTAGIISRDAFAAVLRLVQSYVWRRFILSLPTNALNKIFMSLYDRVEDYVSISDMWTAVTVFRGAIRSLCSSDWPERAHRTC